MFLFGRCVPAFRVNLIDVPLVIRRGRDIEFRCWTGVTLKSPVVLRMSRRRVRWRRGTAGWTYGGFRSGIQSDVLLGAVHVLQILRGFLEKINLLENLKKSKFCLSL